MAGININGKMYVGKKVTFINNKVYIDGVDTTPDAKQITISIEGTVENLQMEYCNKIDIKGDVGEVLSTSGDIYVTGNIGKNVRTVSGDVQANDIGGDVTTTSGDVKCKHIKGNVKTVSGDIG